MTYVQRLTTLLTAPLRRLLDEVVQAIDAAEEIAFEPPGLD